MNIDKKSIEDLENLIREESILTFDPTCIRKKSNISKSSNEYKFDHPNYSPEKLLNDLDYYSPKLKALLENIEKIDEEDRKNHGKLFKHFIFSDLKSSSSGAKLLASALVASHFHSGYDATLKQTSATDPSANTNIKIPKYNKLSLFPDEKLEETENQNFYLLTSTGVYGQAITVKDKKSMLKKFNERPENIHGERIRFIVMDSGFKEGIDLFDIKYIHIFEPSTVISDQKQVIGRGTRTCGQKALEFHPNYGWRLNVFIYDINIPNYLSSFFMSSQTASELYLKSMNIDVRLHRFASELEEISIKGSVDYELNRNIHTFSIPHHPGDVEEPLPADFEFDYDDDGETVGGAKKKKLIIRNDLPTIVWNPPSSSDKQPINNYEEMKKYIRKHFSQYSWDFVKMENKCLENTSNKSAGSQIIPYSPSQEFMRHYFTPQNPLKGVLVNWNPGSGKLCCGIATATSSFEKQGYTILWVTRTTLKSDVWKNMFEQVCNEDIRDKMMNSEFQIPQDQKNRMKLISKSWRIRPMSYKQFSNLILKRNNFYKTLIKINGETDPLRKTLLIIDEAHKLYGGDDLSSIERPDMNVLHSALMNSYRISGNDSVKLMLMTATPMTTNPMEMIQLLNLCRPIEEQLPAYFDDFSETYLNELGGFTEEGKKKYLNDIAGYVSYLNREKDARQFAQPVIEKIEVPIVKNIEDIKRFDKKSVRQYFDGEISKLKEKVLENNQKINEKMSELYPKRFIDLQKKCVRIDDEKEKKDCEKIVKSNIKLLIEEAKESIQTIRQDVKEIRESIKNKNLFKREFMQNISENMDDDKEEYDIFKSSPYFSIKSKCGKTVKTLGQLNEDMKHHPAGRLYDEKIVEMNAKIQDLQEKLKNDLLMYKNQIKEIKEFSKKNPDHLDSITLKSLVKEKRKTVRQFEKIKRKETLTNINKIKKTIKATQKNRKNLYRKLRATMKKKIAEKKRELKDEKQAELKLKKTLDEQEEIKDELLKGLNDKYSKIIDDELYETKQKMKTSKTKKNQKTKKTNTKKIHKTKKIQ